MPIFAIFMKILHIKKTTEAIYMNFCTHNWIIMTIKRKFSKSEKSPRWLPFFYILNFLCSLFVTVFLPVLSNFTKYVLKHYIHIQCSSSNKFWAYIPVKQIWRTKIAFFGQNSTYHYPFDLSYQGHVKVNNFNGIFPILEEIHMIVLVRRLWQSHN